MVVKAGTLLDSLGASFSILEAEDLALVLSHGSAWGPIGVQQVSVGSTF